MDDNGIEFKAGLRVSHDNYGHGEIIDMDTKAFIIPLAIVRQDGTGKLFGAFPESLTILC